MTLDENRFSTLADKRLETIADAIDDALGDKIDADFLAGILTLTLKGGGQYVINKHAPNREIWLSSPISGAAHFTFEDGAWVSTRQPRVVLEQVLAAELKGKYGVEVEF